MLGPKAVQNDTWEWGRSYRRKLQLIFITIPKESHSFVKAVGRWGGGAAKNCMANHVRCRSSGSSEMQNVKKTLLFLFQNIVDFKRTKKKNKKKSNMKLLLNKLSEWCITLVWTQIFSYQLIAQLCMELMPSSLSRLHRPQQIIIQVKNIYIPRCFKGHFKTSHVPGSAQRKKIKMLNEYIRNILKYAKKFLQPIIQKSLSFISNYMKMSSMGHMCPIGTSLKVTASHQSKSKKDSNQLIQDDKHKEGYQPQNLNFFFNDHYQKLNPCIFTLVVTKNVKTFFNHKGLREYVFKAMDKYKVGEVGCPEFVLSITAMDPMTNHGSGPAEQRCRHIFRYYDADSDDMLTKSEVSSMLEDIAKQHRQEQTPETMEEKLQQALTIFEAEEDGKVGLTAFLMAVGNLRFRGTSVLFRSNVSVVSYLLHNRDWCRRVWCQSRSIANYGIDRKDFNDDSRGFSTSNEGDFFMKSIVEESSEVVYLEKIDLEIDFFWTIIKTTKSSIPLSEGAFVSPSYSSSNRDPYSLAQHTVKVRRSGQVTDIHLLLDMERAGEVADTGFDIDHVKLNSQDHEGKGEESEMSVPRAFSRYGPSSRPLNRFQSVEAFNMRSLHQEMLQALRFFEHGKSQKPCLDWGEVDKTKLGQYILSLCHSVKDVFENEPRLLKISPPCYILGDIHGNYRDLVCFEKALWRVGPAITPANFLFLGDYVDRGEYGVEVVAYLFAQKLQAPGKFHLLRGNHEVREIQQLFSFYSECLSKFGDRLGKEIWNGINDAFDCMPIAAIVDRKIFCIHGGIPKLGVSDGLSELRKIPCPLPRPDLQSNIAWQMMWNDPVAAEELTDETVTQLKDNGGFAYNEKRQTAYVFNSRAFDAFLSNNKLTHVVRAHEVKQAGFEIQQRGRLMTVFSSSHYCGGNNEAACVLVHDMRMRVIRIDTS
ncbi:unnamed protein product, partial [Meganyctiphanes norvegica]